MYGHASEGASQTKGPMGRDRMSIVGQEKWQVDTPALWVDLDLMERNIQALAQFFRGAGVAWRPHIKGIKVPAIAHMALDAGAIGVTCAKLSEAEVMAAAGIKDILIANQVVGASKVARLVGLRRHADVLVAVDSLENVQEISQAAAGAGVVVRVLIEVNTGLNRCGLEPGDLVVEFARQVATLPGIELAGLMGWEGHVVALNDPEEKQRRCREAVGLLLRSADLCRAAGFRTPIVSAGGSGTYQITARMPGVTEIQAGGAIFTDVTYRSRGVDLDCSLFILATVVSRPTPTRAVIDAGRKAMGGETMMPQVKAVAGARLVKMNAEHGILELDSARIPLKVGDKIDLVVGYGDSTVFLHDHLFGIRNGRVETAWAIQGRGKLS
jgi:D-serine deaminase-like pyridoxal phosphate-dependent protein